MNKEGGNWLGPTILKFNVRLLGSSVNVTQQIYHSDDFSRILNTPAWRKSSSALSSQSTSARFVMIQHGCGCFCLLPVPHPIGSWRSYPYWELQPLWKRCCCMEGRMIVPISISVTFTDFFLTIFFRFTLHLATKLTGSLLASKVCCYFMWIFLLWMGL